MERSVPNPVPVMVIGALRTGDAEVGEIAVIFTEVSGVLYVKATVGFSAPKVA